jgi:hypothetical protein
MASRQLTVLLTILSTTAVFGQEVEDYKKLSGLRYEYHFNKVHDFQVGYGRIRQRELSMIGAYRSHGYFFNIGYGTNFSNSLLTTRASYEVVEFLLIGRLSLVNYTDFKDNHTHLLPEVGLTFSGLISLTYGYRVNLTDNAFDVSRSSIGLTLTPFP